MPSGFTSEGTGAQACRQMISGQRAKRSCQMGLVALLAGSVVPASGASILITDFFNQAPITVLYGSWFYHTEFPQVRFFNAGGVSGQETYSVDASFMGAGIGTPTAAGGGTATFPPLDLSTQSELEFTALITNGNAASIVRVLLRDTDGTALAWSYLSSQFNTQSFSTVRLPFTSGGPAELGSVAGFDWSQVSSYSIDGGGSQAEAPFFFRFDSLVAVPEPGLFHLLATCLFLQVVYRRRPGPIAAR